MNERLTRPSGSRPRAEQGGLLMQVAENSAETMLIVFLAMAVFIFGLHQLLAVLHRYPLDYGEAPLVDQAMRLAGVGSTQSPRNIYRADLSSPPYTISNYPPLFVATLTPLVALLGPNFWAGRVVSILGAAAVALFLARIVEEKGRHRFAGLVAGAVFWAMPYVVHWSSLLRIDLLALALSTAALYLFVRRPEARPTLIGGGLLLVGAIYTRQSYALAAPLAAFVWLWQRAGWRRALTLAGLVAGVSLALFLLLNALTGGGFFFNIVTANVNEFGWDRLMRNLETLSEDAPFLLLLGAISLGAMPALGVSHWPLVVPYLVGAFLSSLTIGKIGSNVNYFLELCAALSLAAGTWVAWAGSAAAKPWHRWVRVGLLVLLVLQVGWLMRTTLDEYVPRLRERRAATALLQDLEWEIGHAGDPDESPVIGDEYAGLVTLQGWPLYIQPFEMTQLAEAGLWDQAAFVEELREGKFPMVLIHHFPGYDVYKERWTPEMLAAIQHAYAVQRTYADTRLYRPRAGSGTPTEICPAAPWRLPSDGRLGVRWDGSFLDFHGRGTAGDVPVYAVADGLLTRGQGWQGTVAIQHEATQSACCRMAAGAKIWSLYAHMMSADGEDSFVVSDFPPGSTDVPVKAGQLLGYQGAWSGRGDWATWVHVRFAVARGGALPSAEGGAPPAVPGPGGWVSPAPYLGISLDDAAPRTQPLRCQ